MRLIFTGTQVYGPATEDSDIDIVVNSKEAHIIQRELEKTRIEIYKTEDQDSYGPDSGFYFDIGPLKFNIINAIDDITKEKWKRATEGMSKLKPISNRKNRIEIFRTFFENC